MTAHLSVAKKCSTAHPNLTKRVSEWEWETSNLFLENKTLISSLLSEFLGEGKRKGEPAIIIMKTEICACLCNKYEIRNPPT